MAVREYVGARYVPIYVGEWDSTMQTTYEPLSIVTVANVGSYTSKQFVPVGVAITDTDYWVESANMSGQLSALTARVDAAEDDIDTLNERTLRQNRRIVMIADSYANQPDSTHSWTYYLTTLLSDLSYNYTIAQNGLGYYRPGHDASTYFNSQKANITDPDTITDVIICLGLNDEAETVSNVKTAVFNFLDEVHNYMPNAHIWVGYPEAMNYLPDSDINNLTNIIYGIESIVSRYSYASWMSGLEYIMHDTANIQALDPGHPTQNGSLEIARGVQVCINGGQYKYTLSTSGTVNWGDGDTSTCQVLIDGPVTRVKIATIQKSATVNLTSNAWVQVATLSSCRIANRMKESVAICMRDLGGSGRTAIVPAMARTEDNELYIRVYSGAETIRPWIEDITLVMPTLQS